MAAAGDVIAGRYRLRRPIGRGGYGAVWVAEQIGLERPVALKLLLEQRLDPNALERFRREAELAQRLQHPNTVRLLDFGVHGREQPFIVFELLQGESLGSLLARERALPPRRVARITGQILKSLMEAHRQGIVHRDIKPANVFVGAHEGEPDFVKVLDFGIAKHQAPGEKPLTVTGEVVGTPAYMAPEHIGHNQTSPASDVYSVGLLMGEMLAGARLVPGSLVEACQRQLDPAPVPLPPAVLASGLGEIVARATRKPLAERYSNAVEMLADLERATLNLEVHSQAQPSAPLAAPSGPISAPAATASLGPSPPPMPAPRKSKKMPLILGAVGVTLTAIALLSFGALGTCATCVYYMKQQETVVDLGGGAEARYFANDFNPTAFFGSASTFALRQDPSARFAGLDAHGRWYATSLRLDQPGSGVTYHFVTSKGCLDLDVDGDGVKPRRAASCVRHSAPNPRCDLPSFWQRIQRAGGLRPPMDATVTFSSKDGVSASWVVLPDAYTRWEARDDC